jgi:aromatic ring hydroxylase
MPTNEEYFQRWEESAPTPVDTMTAEEIKKAQGTRNNAEAPWKTYDGEFDNDDPALLAAMAEYASNVSDAEGSSQTKDELARLKQSSHEAAREYQWVTPEEYE